MQLPKAFEGGHVIGQDEVRAYWLRQWSEINPVVVPVSKVLFDTTTKHVCTFDGERIVAMDIEN